MVRAGPYGNITFGQFVLAEFQPEIGRTYEVVLEIKDGKLTATIDDKVMGTVEMTNPEPTGFVGLYTENPAVFDDFEVSGKFQLDPLKRTPLTGEPNLKLEFTEWMPTPKRPYEAFSLTGSIYLYYRNTGTGPAEIESLSVGGDPITLDKLPPWIGFYRQRPFRIEPGEVGQLQVAFTF